MISSSHMSPKSQSGVGLLEVLIALLIFAIGALGYAGLQLRAMGNAADANYRAYAAMVAQDAVERIRANPGQEAHYGNSQNWSKSPTAGAWQVACEAQGCDADVRAQTDVLQLLWTARTTIPGGAVTVRACGFSSLDCVIVSWDGQDPSGCIGAGGITSDADSKCFVMEIVQ